MKIFKRLVFFIVFFTITTLLISCQEFDPLEKILEQITIPTEITSNLDLKDEYTYEGYTAKATWHSTDSSIISSDGKITVDLNDRSVTLQLTLTLDDGRRVTKNYDIIVKGNTDLLVLYAVYNSKIKNMSRTIESDIELPTTYELNGQVVSAMWESSNPSILSADGKVTRTYQDVTVTLTVTLTLNLAQRVETFDVTVLQDPNTQPINYYHLVDVYQGIIANEAPDPATPQCFPGAIYRKVVSSRDYWLGIEAVVTLGEFTVDPERLDEERKNKNLNYYLDNASLYMGGNATYESDIGLTWSIGYESATSNKITQVGIAYRPFWRYNTAMETGKKENIYKNANVKSFEYYYFPGDKIRMSVISPKSNYLQMRIELLELTTIPKYVEQRAKYNLGTDFNRVFVTDPFPSEGMGKVKTEFKRVNAIDQVGNEGKPTINTNAKVTDAIWHEVYLYRMIDGEVKKVPMTEKRSASMTCPLGRDVNGDFSKTFTITYNGVNKDLGGEIVTINPNNGTGRKYNSVAITTKRDDKEYI